MRTRQQMSTAFLPLAVVCLLAGALYVEGGGRLGAELAATQSWQGMEHALLPPALVLRGTEAGSTQQSPRLSGPPWAIAFSARSLPKSATNASWDLLQTTSGPASLDAVDLSPSRSPPHFSLS
jgi:hypothetical protein